MTQSSGTVVIAVAAILSVAGLAVAALNRDMVSFEGFVMAAAAAFLGGIYNELSLLRRAGKDEERDRDDRASGVDQ